MIRTKESRKHLKNFKGCYAYSYVDRYGDPIDLNIVTDTYLDNEGFVNGVTYCKIPAVDSDGEFSAFNTYSDVLDEYSEHSCDIIIYTKDEVGEIIKTLQYVYNEYSNDIEKEK